MRITAHTAVTTFARVFTEIQSTPSSLSRSASVSNDRVLMSATVPEVFALGLETRLVDDLAHDDVEDAAFDAPNARQATAVRDVGRL